MLMKQVHDDANARTKSAVAERLTLTRQALGLAQGDFGARANIAANTYNQWERGKNVPSLDQAHALCDAHDLTLDWIYRGDPSGLRYQLADAIRALLQARAAQNVEERQHEHDPDPARR